MLGNFGKAVKCCATTKVKLNLKALLPSRHDQFYHYSGSLTTPPCYESVQWFVNRNPIVVSEDQMKIFRTLKDVPMGNSSLVNHYRPVQPLNRRTVLTNFDPSDEGCKGAAVSLQPVSTIILTIVVLFTFSV